jgi:hypothetical protein
VVGLVALLQVSVGAPPPLEAARGALAHADTSAAVASLVELVRPDTVYTPEETAALLLLRWMARSPSQDSLMDVWDHAMRAVRERRDAGVGWTIAHETQYVLRGMDDHQTDGQIVKGLGTFYRLQPRSWQEQLRKAAVHATNDRLGAAAARWVAVEGWLADIDRFAVTLPTVTPPAGCQRGCMVRQLPPRDIPLLRRLRMTGLAAAQLDSTWSEVNGALTVGRASALDSLMTGLDDLRPSPWPFNELAERLRVTACALLRVEPLAKSSTPLLRSRNGENAEQAAAKMCLPAVEGLDSVVAAELNAVRYEFDGHAGLAARAMDAAPERFAMLDGSLDLLFGDPFERGGRFPGAAGARRPPPGPRATAAPPGFWRTAWPLYLLPYNERLIAHRSRLLLADLSRRFATSADEQNLFGAYGDPRTLVPIGVPLALARPWGGEGPGLVTYMPVEMHETIVRRGRGMEGVSLDLALAARSSVNPLAVSGFTAEDYDSFGPLDHQVVQYVRDGRQHVELYTRWVPAPLCENPRPLLGFFLLDANLRMLSRAIDVNPMEPPRLKRFHLQPSAGTYVYSLEMLDRSCRTAERARYVLRVPPVDSIRISDLMLADELYLGDERWSARIKDRPPVTVRPSLNVNAGTVARFYWEVYDIPADSIEAGRLRVSFEVVNVREEQVAVRELGDVAAQARRRPGTLDIQYDQTLPAGSAPLGFGLAVGLPEGTRGVHLARVHIEDTKTGTTVSAERAFYVRG